MAAPGRCRKDAARPWPAIVASMFGRRLLSQLTVTAAAEEWMAVVEVVVRFLENGFPGPVAVVLLGVAVVSVAGDACQVTCELNHAGEAISAALAAGVIVVVVVETFEFEIHLTAILSTNASCCRGFGAPEMSQTALRMGEAGEVIRALGAHRRLHSTASVAYLALSIHREAYNLKRHVSCLMNKSQNQSENVRDDHVAAAAAAAANLPLDLSWDCASLNYLPRDETDEEKHIA